MPELIKRKKLEHSPTLNTVFMVEETLKNTDESVISVAELKRKLPKQINHNTLKLILEYLEGIPFETVKPTNKIEFFG
mgnify:CR=1 FL=1